MLQNLPATQSFMKKEISAAISVRIITVYSCKKDRNLIFKRTVQISAQCKKDGNLIFKRTVQ